jgi:hypothetical protein
VVTYSRPPAVVAGAVVVGLLLAGCGGGSDEDQAISTAEDFFGAFADVDAERVCELNLGADGEPLSEDHEDWQRCLDAVDTWANNTMMPADGELPEASFESVEINGDTARISESPPDEYSFIFAFDLEKIDGDWYIDGSWYN